MLRRRGRRRTLAEAALGAPLRTLDRAAEIGRLLSGQADADAAVAWLDGIVARLGVPRLGALGVDAADLPAIAKQAQRSSSMKGNAIALSVDELVAILRASS